MLQHAAPDACGSGQARRIPASAMAQNPITSLPVDQGVFTLRRVSWMSAKVMNARRRMSSLSKRDKIRR